MKKMSRLMTAAAVCTVCACIAVFSGCKKDKGEFENEYGEGVVIWEDTEEGQEGSAVGSDILKDGINIEANGSQDAAGDGNSAEEQGSFDNPASDNNGGADSASGANQNAGNDGSESGQTGSNTGTAGNKTDSNTGSNGSQTGGNGTQSSGNTGNNTNQSGNGQTNNSGSTTKAPSDMTYAEYLKLSRKEQQEFYESFDDPQDYIEWHRKAEAAYEKDKDVIDTSGGVIDLEEILGGKK